MSRAKDILEQIMLEDADAVLYSVMRSFLKRRAKEQSVDVNTLMISFSEEENTIDIYRDYECAESQCIECIETVKV